MFNANAAGFITKSDSHYKMRQFYHKMQQVITQCSLYYKMY